MANKNEIITIIGWILTVLGIAFTIGTLIEALYQLIVLGNPINLIAWILSRISIVLFAIPLQGGIIISIGVTLAGGLMITFGKEK